MTNAKKKASFAKVGVDGANKSFAKDPKSVLLKGFDDDTGDATGKLDTLCFSRVRLSKLQICFALFSHDVLVDV